MRSHTRGRGKFGFWVDGGMVLCHGSIYGWWEGVKGCGDFWWLELDCESERNHKLSCGLRIRRAAGSGKQVFLRRVDFSGFDGTTKGLVIKNVTPRRPRRNTKVIVRQE